MADTAAKSKKKKGQSIREAAAAEDRRQASARQGQRIPVTFGGVSLGLKTCRIGISIERKGMRINQADEIFVDRRLIGRIEIVRDGEEPEQQNFIEDENVAISAAFDVTKFGATKDHYTTGLTMRKKDVEVGLLDLFVNRSGFLIIDSTTDIVREKKGAEAEGPQIDFGDDDEDDD